MIKKIWDKIPKLPLSALIFYLSLVCLRLLNLIPGPDEIIILLEGWYNSYGLAGLFIASFLEGIVYLGLYFPGSFIVALAVIFSDGKFISLLMISIVVSLALTLTAVINYSLGKKISKKDKFYIPQKGRGLVLSMIHPNTLAFYFFNHGIRHRNFRQIFLIPVVIVPYGLALAYLLYPIKESVKSALESPLFIISLILIWIIFAFIFDSGKKTDF